MLIEDPRGRRWSVHRRWLGLRRPRCVGALVLSGAGLLLTALVVLGLVSEHHQVA